MKYFEDNSLSIGNTPLVKLNKIIGSDKALVLGKIEGRNPAYSVKCRIGANMIWDAEKRGVLKPGMEIISVGPTIKNPHSPFEYVEVTGVGVLWEFLKSVAKRMALL